MGGGGAMRAAAKVAGIGVVAGGGSLRGVPSIPPAENMVSAAARKASRPVTSIVSSHHDRGVSGGEAVAHVQRPSWELEDWEFAGYEEEVSLVTGKPLPRVVFGGAPTMEEAKEATSELKDALEKVYVKPANSTRSEGSFILGQEPSLPILLSNSDYSETKACVISETAASKHALHAFKFLSESPAAQTVVASIACDPNVWNAVMQNEELTKYLQSHKIAAPSPEVLNAKRSAADGNFQEQEYPNDAEQPFGESRSGIQGTSFVSFFENVKVTVVDMFSNLSSFVQNIFGGSVAEKKSEDADGSEGATFMDTTVLGSSFMGLAVFVIMLVALKRG